MGEKRPKRYGEISEPERATIKEIIFHRQMKLQSFQKIADDLNAQSIWPRRAPKWSWGLVRNVYLKNTKPPGSGEYDN